MGWWAPGPALPPSSLFLGPGLLGEVAMGDGVLLLQAWGRCSRTFLRAQLRAVPSAGSCCPGLPPRGLGKRPGFLRASVKLCPPRCSYGSVRVLPQLSPSPFPVLASLEDPAMHGTPWGCCPGSVDSGHSVDGGPGSVDGVGRAVREPAAVGGLTGGGWVWVQICDLGAAGSLGGRPGVRKSWV